MAHVNPPSWFIWDVSTCNNTKAFPTDVARSSGLSSAEWEDILWSVTSVRWDTREVLTQALFTRLLRGMDAFFQLLSATQTLMTSPHNATALGWRKSLLNTWLTAWIFNYIVAKSQWEYLNMNQTHLVLGLYEPTWWEFNL